MMNTASKTLPRRLSLLSRTLATVTALTIAATPVVAQASDSDDAAETAASETTTEIDYTPTSSQAPASQSAPALDAPATLTPPAADAPMAPAAQPAEPAPQPAPAPALTPTPVATAPVALMPTAPAVDYGYADRLESQGRRRRTAGAVLLTTGLLELGAGTALTLLGNKKRNYANDHRQEWNDNDTHETRFTRENDKAKLMQIGGGVLLVTGLVGTITGSVLVGVGNSKIRRAREHRSIRPTASVLDGGGMVGLEGRF